MANTVELRARLDFWKKSLEKLQTAYLYLLDGGVKSYRIGNRELTHFDLPKLQDEIKVAEKKIDELTALLKSEKPRRAVAVIPRDW